MIISICQLTVKAIVDAEETGATSVLELHVETPY